MYDLNNALQNYSASAKAKAMRSRQQAAEVRKEKAWTNWPEMLKKIEADALAKDQESDLWEMRQQFADEGYLLSTDGQDGEWMRQYSEIFAEASKAGRIAYPNTEDIEEMHSAEAIKTAMGNAAAGSQQSWGGGAGGPVVLGDKSSAPTALSSGM